MNYDKLIAKKQSIILLIESTFSISEWYLRIRIQETEISGTYVTFYQWDVTFRITEKMKCQWVAKLILRWLVIISDEWMMLVSEAAKKLRQPRWQEIKGSLILDTEQLRILIGSNSKCQVGSVMVKQSRKLTDFASFITGLW